MRRLFAWIAGLVSIAALARLLRRRRRKPAPASIPAEPPAGEDPADELRDRLAKARADEPVVMEEDDPAVVEEQVEEPSSLDERRARVHERAQEAIDAMRDPPEGA